MTERISRTQAETEAIAGELAATLSPGAVVALRGELGSGKTAFVRGLARALGISPAAVSSPTFTIEHRYASPSGAGLVHIDAYRLRGADELQVIGWDELMSQREAIVAVEWADRVAAALPASCVWVRMEHAPDGARRIEIAPR